MTVIQTSSSDPDFSAGNCAAWEGAHKHDVEVAGLFLPFALEAEVVRLRFAVLAVAIRLETCARTTNECCQQI